MNLQRPREVLFRRRRRASDAPPRRQLRVHSPLSQSAPRSFFWHCSIVQIKMINYEYVLLLQCMERLFHFVTMVSKTRRIYYVRWQSMAAARTRLRCTSPILSTSSSPSSRQAKYFILCNRELCLRYFGTFFNFQNKEDYFQFEDVGDLCNKWSHMIMRIDQVIC